MKGKIKYEFSCTMWKHDSPGGWYFVSLPKRFSKEIMDNLKWQEEGWGRMKAHAQLGELTWETAIWFDTKMDTYILPIKSEIRKKTGISTEKEVRMVVWI